MDAQTKAGWSQGRSDALSTWLGAQANVEPPRIVSATSPAVPGFSSETLMVSVQWSDRIENLVLRIAPTSHAVFLDSAFDAQVQVLQALATTGVRVPMVPYYEPTGAVLGAPFFLMNRVDGRAVEDNPYYHVGGWVADLQPSQREALWWAGVDAMNSVHALNWRDLDLSVLERPHRAGRIGLQQEIAYWKDATAWAQESGPIPVLHELWSWLDAHQPGQEPDANLCWGDARLANTLFNGTEVAALLDWEMVTLGPAEMDIAWWLFFDRFFADSAGVPRLAGLPSHEDTIARCEQALGRKLVDLRWFDTFAACRLTVITARIMELATAAGAVPAEPDFRLHNPVADYAHVVVQRLRDGDR